MRKNKKVMFSVGVLAIIATPVATVISCGESSSGFAKLGINAISVGGTPSAMNKLVSEDITAAGSWGDSRFFAKENKDKLHVVGIEKKRISNDGIQARGNMKASDQKAIQMLFTDLVSKAVAQKKNLKKLQKSNPNAKGPDSLLIKDGKDWKTVFDVYSHIAYKSLKKGDKIGVLNGTDLVEQDAIGGSIAPADTFDAKDSEYFTKAIENKNISFDTDLSKYYATKKQINITFIPSNDPTLIVSATKKLQKYLENIGVKAIINLSNDYDSAAVALEKQQVDLAFLPAGTWSADSPSTNFILQAARPSQVSTMSIMGDKATMPKNKISSEFNAVYLFNKYGQLYLRDVTTKKLSDAKISDKQKEFKKEAAKKGSPESKILSFANKAKESDFLSGEYESWIFTKKGNSFDKIIYPLAQKDKEWKLPYNKVSKILKYGYNSTTSSASYEFPELWFAEHFTK
ncbi:hypothetical protein MYMA111404_04200 [Mycoplasma marinum]|uniref:Uncharacterized protein n=1 Tax=Mycoplasma marinum TaxID=1937190 RepID=A0A4R0XQT9_9MOLU|nr:hypothetical protein [Mycoplasma marinum]TCG10730.1 hypothetical protein C4B24_04050 [Mycoplasma marinum]